MREKLSAWLYDFTYEKVLLLPILLLILCVLLVSKVLSWKPQQTPHIHFGKANQGN